MKNRKQRKESLKELVTRSIHSVVDPISVLNRTEKRLEEELNRESRRQSEYRTSPVDKVRTKGERILHSKCMLLLIVIFNIIDCALVLGEIMLDIHYVKGFTTLSTSKFYWRKPEDPEKTTDVWQVLSNFFTCASKARNHSDLMEETEAQQQAFIDSMQELHPGQFENYDFNGIHLVYGKLIDENWTRCGDANQAAYHSRRSSGSDVKNKAIHDEAGIYRTDQSDDTTHSTSDQSEIRPFQMHETTGMSTDEKIAHVFHKTSIAILTFLLIETIIKIGCLGRDFFGHKLEVFDAFIVLGSFVLDLVFLKGLTVYKVRDLVFILTFILPWRIIRVLNSLLVAVLDHEHFRLKLLYSEKKQIAAQLKELRYKENRFEGILKKVENFCEGEGIPSWKIRQHTVFGNIKQNTVSSLALSTSNLVNSMLECPSIDGNIRKCPDTRSTTSRRGSLSDCEIGFLEDEGTTSTDKDGGSNVNNNGTIKMDRLDVPDRKNVTIIVSDFNC